MKTDRTLTLAVVGLALVGGAACSKGCGEDLPTPDICAGPRDGTVAAAEIGQGELAGFVPFADGDVVRFVFSDDGVATLPITFRLTGDDVPRCVDHRTELLSCPADEACADGGTSRVVMIAPLHAYPPEEGGTTSETHVLYLPLDRENEPEDGDRLELVSRIAGIDLRVQLWLATAGPDAASVDAGP
jgi:hypothetical protein